MSSFDFIEGFDYYPTDPAASGVGVAATWIQTGWGQIQALVDGRFLPGKSVRLGGPPGGSTMTRVVNPDKQKALGFAIYLENVGQGRDGIGVPRFALADPQGVAVGTLMLNFLGELRFGWAGFDLSLPGPRVLLNATWHYIEIVSETVGANSHYAFYIDGELQQEFRGAGPDKLIGRLQFLTDNNLTSIRVDDMYSQSGATEVLGECRIQLLEPSVDSAIAWDPHPAGGGNFANVDDSDVDLDATYNSTNNVGAKDLFAATQITVNPSVVHAVGICSAARKEDSGTRTVRNILSVGGVQLNGDDYNLTTQYTWNRDIFTEAPGGVAWTKESANSMLAGYELRL